METIRQDILQYIRFNMLGIEEKILEEKRNYPNLFEEDNGIILKTDKSEWNEDYISFLLVKTRKNFSEKKINHLINVRNYVRDEIEQNTNPCKVRSFKKKEQVKDNENILELLYNQGKKILNKAINYKNKKLK